MTTIRNGLTLREKNATRREMVRLVRCTECDGIHKRCVPCAACPDAQPRHCAHCHAIGIADTCNIPKRNTTAPEMPAGRMMKKTRAIKTAPGSGALPSAARYVISDAEEEEESSDSSSTSESEDALAAESLYDNAPTIVVAVDHYDAAPELAYELPTDLAIPPLPPSAFSLVCDYAEPIEREQPDTRAPIEGKKASLKIGEVTFAPDRGLSFQINVNDGEGCASKIVDPTWFARPKGAELAANAARLVQRAVDKMSKFPGVANWREEIKRKRVELEEEQESKKMIEIELAAANERLAEAERMIVCGAREARAESANEIAALLATRATVERDRRAMLAEIAQLKAENGELDARVTGVVKTRDDFATTVGCWAKQRRTDTQKILGTVKSNLAALHAAQQSIEGVFVRQLGAFDSLTKAMDSDDSAEESVAQPPFVDSTPLDPSVIEAANAAQSIAKDVVDGLDIIDFDEFDKLLRESPDVGFETNPEPSPFVAAVVVGV